MPGVPPDAVAQVKKGLRGLFSRRKSKQGQQTQAQPTSATHNAPTSTTTAADAAPAAAAASSTTEVSKTGTSHNPPPPQPASTDPNKAPQLSEPSQSELAKDIDLNPSANESKTEPPPGSSGLSATAASKTEPPKITTSTQSTGASEPTATKAPESSTAGMSATSGPLGDHLGEGYIDDDDLQVGPKGETLDEGKAVEEEGKVEQEGDKMKQEAQKIEQGETLGEGAKA